jgi:hypothetical protein
MKNIRGNRRGGHYNLFYSIFVYNIYLYLDTVFIIIANPIKDQIPVTMSPTTSKPDAKGIFDGDESVECDFNN